MERFCLSRVSQSGGWQRRAWLGSNAISRGIFLSRRVFVFPWKNGSGSHMSDLSSSQCGRHVLSAWSGRVKLSEQLFLWKSRHKPSLSLRKILEVRFHKQLHDCKELQLSSRPGKFYISNFSFICMSCKVSWGSGLNYHCLTARSLRKRNVSACQATQT